MIEALLTWLNVTLQQSFGIALLGAALWGVFSILLSPCHLSSIPLVIGVLAQESGKSGRRAFTLSLLFALGILASIAGIGLITAAAGRMLGDLGRIGNILIAAVFLLFGAYLMDLIRLDWSLLRLPEKKSGLSSALLLGLLFGIGLGPCTFAFVAPVLALVFARSQTDMFGATLLLTAFALGHCGVIVLAGTLSSKLQTYLEWTQKNRSALWFKRACGLLVALAGVYWIWKSL
jgi:cytochrome c-type biogenesis protein